MLSSWYKAAHDMYRIYDEYQFNRILAGSVQSLADHVEALHLQLSDQVASLHCLASHMH